MLRLPVDAEGPERFGGSVLLLKCPSEFVPDQTLGGLLATWVTFTPCFLWIFVGAPYIEHLRGDKALAGAMSAIRAAVVGVILNLTA